MVWFRRRRWARIDSLFAGLLAPIVVATAVAVPVTPFDVINGFTPPEQPWGVGHRGVDLRAEAGQPVYAVASGLVVYAGRLVDRPVISIRHGFVRTTYEPVQPVITKGERVDAGQLIGRVSGSHESCAGFCLHLGALAGEQYLDPVRLLGIKGPPVLRPVW